MATRQHLIRVTTTSGGDSNGLSEFIPGHVDGGPLIPAYTEVAKRLGILHEQSNISAVNVTKLSSVKKKSK